MMNSTSPHYTPVIDLSDIFRRLYKGRRTFFYVLPATFVVTCLIVLSIPRYYRCEVTLAPEQNDPASGMSSSLGALASSFGLNVGGGLGTTDAISPILYPEVLKSTDFLVGMFSVKVQKPNGQLTTYYDYLKRDQRYPWWTLAYQTIKNLFISSDNQGNNKAVNAFRLTREQTNIAHKITDKIKCTIDKKTDVITIRVEDQSPVVAASLADTARIRLQNFITNYRTNKARTDLAYAKQLHDKAKQDYIRARRVYISYSDANQDLVLKSFQSKTEDLENEMQLKYNIYTSTATQLQMAYAKVQERTPVFTTLERATVPLKPAGPKRMLFVAAMLVLSFIVTSTYLLIRKA